MKWNIGHLEWLSWQPVFPALISHWLTLKWSIRMKLLPIHSQTIMKHRSEIITRNATGHVFCMSDNNFIHVLRYHFNSLVFTWRDSETCKALKRIVYSLCLLCSKAKLVTTYNVHLTIDFLNAQSAYRTCFFSRPYRRNLSTPSDTQGNSPVTRGPCTLKFPFIKLN